MTSPSIRFYFKKGRWRVTSDKKPVLAIDWWTAVNQVKCLNHRLRMKERELQTNAQREPGRN